MISTIFGLKVIQLCAKFAIMKEADVAAVEYKMEVLRNLGM